LGSLLNARWIVLRYKAEQYISVTIRFLYDYDQIYKYKLPKIKRSASLFLLEKSSKVSSFLLEKSSKVSSSCSAFPFLPRNWFKHSFYWPEVMSSGILTILSFMILLFLFWFWILVYFKFPNLLEFPARLEIHLLILN